MNQNSPQATGTTKLDAKKILVILVVLAIAGYQYYLQSKAPQNAPQADQQAQLDPQIDELGDRRFDLDPASSNNVSDSPSVKKKTAYLSDGRRGSKVSPEGLEYTDSRSGEHRTEHVLRHARDIPNRSGSHGVFLVDHDDEVFELIDEAYRLIKQNSKRVKKDPSRGDGKTAYVVDMKRKIGYRGGQSGQRSGNPPLSRLKLVLAENRVITAYPY